MKLENEFVVPVPRDQAWDVLMDVERIAPCMPGATFDGYEGESFSAFKGRVKVKLGPITVTYAGVAEFIEKDKDAGRAVIDAAGRESRGSGTANATIETILVDNGDTTLVKVTTDLNITGKPAQFGRGVMVEVGTKILGQFATCLADKLGSGEPGASAPASPTDDSGGEAVPSDNVVALAGQQAAQQSAPARPTADAIDLLDTAGAPVLKRLLPALGGLLGVLIVWRLLRGARHVRSGR